MSKKSQTIFFLVIVLLIIILLPIVVPVPPLNNIQPVEDIKYANSQFEEINGLKVHFIEQGSGGSLILLLHGFGSSTYSWEKVIGDFSQFGTVVAFDRPGFGLSERPLQFESEASNPYGSQFQFEIIKHFMLKYQAEKVTLVGNSAGGTVAIQFAMENPALVDRLILVDPAVYGAGGAPAWIKPLLNTYLANKWGPYFVRTIEDRGLELLKMAWYNPDLISEDDLKNYQKPLMVENWDIGLWQFTKINGENNIAERLTTLELPVLVIAGAEDKIIPVADIRKAADEIPAARYVELESCGHVPQEECPQRFMQAIHSFLEKNN